MTQRIAVVDDDARLRDLVVGYLSGQGLETVGLDGGAALRAAMASRGFDLVVLDMMMPGEDGLSVLRWLRTGSTVPVIMLTAADNATDRVLGLELGADDYVTKPADLRELLARIRANLRRSAIAPAPPPPAATPGFHAATKPPPRDAWFGRWRLDRTRRRLVDADSVPLELTGHEFALLTVFADHPNVVLSRDRLLELSGTDATEVFDRAIDMRVTRLRKKIEPVSGVSTVIRTVRGHGGGYEYVPSDGPNHGT